MTLLRIVEALRTFEETHGTNQSYSRSYCPECERACTPVRTQATETLRRRSYFRHGASGLTGCVHTVESMLAVSVHPARLNAGVFGSRVVFTSQSSSKIIGRTWRLALTRFQTEDDATSRTRFQLQAKMAKVWGLRSSAVEFDGTSGIKVTVSGAS